jgi:hypothetical protein
MVFEIGNGFCFAKSYYRMQNANVPGNFRIDIGWLLCLAGIKSQ